MFCHPIRLTKILLGHFTWLPWLLLCDPDGKTNFSSTIHAKVNQHILSVFLCSQTQSPFVRFLPTEAVQVMCLAMWENWLNWQCSRRHIVHALETWPLCAVCVGGWRWGGAVTRFCTNFVYTVYNLKGHRWHQREHKCGQGPLEWRLWVIAIRALSKDQRELELLCRSSQTEWLWHILGVMWSLMIIEIAPLFTPS